MAGLRSELSEFRGSIAGDVAIVDVGGRLGEACQALDDRDLAIPAGTCPPVGLAGLTLGADSASMAGDTAFSRYRHRRREAEC
jgi:hypothetical protein